MSRLLSLPTFYLLTCGHSFGLSFLGTAWSEASLISFAYAYEQRTMVRNQVQPFIVPNAELSNIVEK